MKAMAKANTDKSTISMRVIRKDGKIEDHGIVAGGPFMVRLKNKLKRIFRR